jgi:hypothetical protein
LPVSFYLLRFERVDNLGAYSIPFGDRPSHPICLRQLCWIFLVIGGYWLLPASFASPSAHRFG